MRYVGLSDSDSPKVGQEASWLRGDLKLDFPVLSPAPKPLDHIVQLSDSV